jgi:tRNA (cmo5U34)-methyltransferase
MELVAGKKVKFNFDTISNFDGHISASIKGYDLLDSLVLNICSFFAKKETTIIDLGCASGRIISRLAEIYPDNQCTGYDITDHNFVAGTRAKLVKQDITASDFYIPAANIILSVFTMQFINFTDRLYVLQKVFASLQKGGVFIFCEKTTNETGIFQEVFTFANYDYKKSSFTPGQILDKEKDLRRIMSCFPSKTNKKWLRLAGFRHVTPFFQSLNFKGWLCMK